MPLAAASAQRPRNRPCKQLEALSQVVEQLAQGEMPNDRRCDSQTVRQSDGQTVRRPDAKERTIRSALSQSGRRDFPGGGEPERAVANPIREDPEMNRADFRPLGS